MSEAFAIARRFRNSRITVVSSLTAVTAQLLSLIDKCRADKANSASETMVDAEVQYGRIKEKKGEVSRSLVTVSGQSCSQ